MMQEYHKALLSVLHLNFALADPASFFLATNHESFYPSAILFWNCKYCFLKKPEGEIWKISSNIRDGFFKESFSPFDSPEFCLF